MLILLIEVLDNVNFFSWFFDFVFFVCVNWIIKIFFMVYFFVIVLMVLDFNKKGLVIDL